MKRCNTCKKSKPERDFNKHKANSDGLQGQCKKCQKEYLAQWKKENKERVNKQNAEAAKRRLAKDPEGVREKRRNYMRDWYKKNKNS